MAKPPFTSMPLDTGTYGSRIDDFMNAGNNYVISGFKPGYALQAAELNEIQEQFLYQQRLSNSCTYNWRNANPNHVPFWNGTTPYNPINISSSGSTSLNVTANQGWYYLIDSASGMGYWIWINTGLSITVSHADAGFNATRYGFTYTKEFINSDQDDTLTDNSNSANTNMNIPGADRYKITNISLVKYAGDSSAFSEIFGAKRTSPTQFGLFWPYGDYSTSFATGSN